MSLEEKQRLILALDVLIRSKIPGKADYLAKRLGISRSTFFRLIEYMREDLYAPIFFDAPHNRYAYETEGLIMLRFLSAEIISPEQIKKVTGGWIRYVTDNKLSQVSTDDTCQG